MTSLTDIIFARAECFARARSSNAPLEARAEAFAALARLNTLSMIAYAGSGHIGSSFSALDIVTWLHLAEMSPIAKTADQAGDIFFSSKGHDAPGLYAALIGFGLIPESGLKSLRRLGGLPGHPDLILTDAIPANTGSLGMGISKAKGMALGRRLVGLSGRIYVMTGDGELQEGQIWESLGLAARLKLSEITVIVDHNKVQSDTLVANTADLGELEAKVRAFGWHVIRCNGHNFAELGKALAQASEETERPSFIIADTVKGCGVSFMEHTAMGERWYRYHSGAPSWADYERAIVELQGRADAALAAIGAGPLEIQREPAPQPPAPPVSVQRMVKAYSEALLDEAERNQDIVALDADLILDTGLIPFQARFPDRFIECGIAEQDMVSMASGLALTGRLPVVHSFSCFLTPRANEQAFNAATEAKRIMYVGSLAGLLPAGPGHSHQSVRDIALMGSIPGVCAIEPCCEDEVRLAVKWALRDSDCQTYLRLVSIPCDVPYALPQSYSLTPGQGTVLRDGGDVAVFGYGPVLLPEAWKAAVALEAEGCKVRLVNLPWLNVIDSDWLATVIQGVRHVITLDNHVLVGGQGARIAAAVAELGGPRVTCFGVEGVPACGTNAEVLARHGLDSASLRARIKAIVGN